MDGGDICGGFRVGSSYAGLFAMTYEILEALNSTHDGQKQSQEPLIVRRLKRNTAKVRSGPLDHKERLEAGFDHQTRGQVRWAKNHDGFS